MHTARRRAGRARVNAIKFQCIPSIAACLDRQASDARRVTQTHTCTVCMQLSQQCERPQTRSRPATGIPALSPHRRHYDDSDRPLACWHLREGDEQHRICDMTSRSIISRHILRSRLKISRLDTSSSCSVDAGGRASRGLRRRERSIRGLLKQQTRSQWFVKKTFNKTVERGKPRVGESGAN